MGTHLFGSPCMFKIKIEAVSESYLKKNYFRCVWIGFTFCSVKKVESLTF